MVDSVAKEVTPLPGKCLVPKGLKEKVAHCWMVGDAVIVWLPGQSGGRFVGKVGDCLTRRLT